MTWSAEEINIVIKLYGKKTAREIAKLLQNKTRCAVIGKARRLRLNKETGEVKSFIEPAKNTKRVYINKTTAPLKKGKISDTAFGETLKVPENGRCRWPVGDPKSKGFCYCGGEIKEGRLHNTGRSHIYCHEHYTCSVSKNQKRKEKKETGYISYRKCNG